MDFGDPLGVSFPNEGAGFWIAGVPFAKRAYTACMCLEFRRFGRVLELGDVLLELLRVCRRIIDIEVLSAIDEKKAGRCAIATIRGSRRPDGTF